MSPFFPPSPPTVFTVVIVQPRAGCCLLKPVLELSRTGFKLIVDGKILAQSKDLSAFILARGSKKKRKSQMKEERREKPDLKGKRIRLVKRESDKEGNGKGKRKLQVMVSCGYIFMQMRRKLCWHQKVESFSLSILSLSGD